jgi:hypothetical protein
MTQVRDQVRDQVHDQVHLVGSIPLRDATEVFETVSSILGPHITRIPDGETGARAEWLGWLEHVFADNPAFEISEETFLSLGSGERRRRYRLKGGVDASDVRLTGLRHAGIAIASYQTYEHLRGAGKIPAHCKFQFAFAHPLSVVRRFIVDEQQAAVHGPYEAALIAEIGKIAGAIPHERLAIQWDVASAIFATLQIGEPTRFGRTKPEMQQAFAQWNVRLGNAVPADIDLIFHLCYGSANNRHSVEPVDLADAVDHANRISDSIARPIQVFHMPVPIDRSDEAYFAPLQALRLRPETRLCLGLIHDQDGADGTRRRAAVAKRYVPDFMIATECGFGRRPPESVGKLLQLHAELAAG